MAHTSDGRYRHAQLCPEARSTLMLLSRNGVFARPLDSSDCTVQIYRKCAGGDRELGHCTQSAWLGLVARSFVQTSKRKFDWTISNAGRLALKAGSTKSAKVKGKAGPHLQTPRTYSTSARPKVSDCESPLTWLAKRCRKNGKAIIDSAQYEAGERLRRDFQVGQMQPRVTMSWVATGQGHARGRRGPSDTIVMSDRALAARDRVNKALAAVGPELAGILVDVCCCFQGLEATEKRAGWPRRSGKVILLLALTRLARHYGLKPDEKETTRKSGRNIRHWGEDDYRPVIASDLN